MDSNNGTVVVARTRDSLEAQIWLDMLRDQGLEAALFEQGVHGALGGARGFGGTHHVVVRRVDLTQARNTLADAGAAHALAPVPDSRESSSRMLQALLAAGGVAVGFLLLLAIVQAAAG